jgi:putative ABC transport system permease protein
MIRHLFKLVWNRRRANSLILIELLLSFLVLGGVLTITCKFLHNWRKPLGFAYENVWNLDVSVGSGSVFNASEERLEQIWQEVDQFVLMLKDLDEVEAAALLPTNVPFSRSRWMHSTYINGAPFHILTCQTWPELKEVLDLELRSGRWLEPGDADLNWRPVVLTESYARALFGRNDPLGQTMPIFDDDGNTRELEEDEKERRVVGVIADYRRAGELSPAPYCEFRSMGRRPGAIPPSDFILRLRPDVTAAFEETLVRRIQQTCPGWEIRVSPLTRLRADLLRQDLLPLGVGAILAGFLILMVGLGLIGVLWQSVTRRTDEMGVRRALGATAPKVRWQILGELLALSVLAVAAGTALFLQLPILEVFSTVPWAAYILAIVLAFFVICVFVLLCGLYPSWLATRVQPAEALQCE